MGTKTTELLSVNSKFRPKGNQYESATPFTDTAVLAQSRFILLETMMILFSLIALYSVVRFRRFHSEPFSANWWTWITAAAFFMGAAFW